MSPIKENSLSVIQKVTVILLAFLLFFSMLPVGLIPEPKEADPNGEFIRIFPSAEIYNDTAERNSDSKKIGRGYSAYYTFNIASLEGTDISDIHSVRLQFAFLKGSVNLNNKIDIDVLDNMPQKTIAGNTPILSETKIASIYPQTTYDEDSLSAIDVTQHIKSLIKSGKNELFLRLSASTPVCVNIATTANNDLMYRPCLKVVTGEAMDTDAHTLKKAELHDAVYVSSSQSKLTGSALSVNENKLITGGGNEIYLRFNVNDTAILGSVYSAVLSLDKLDGEGNNIKIYCINNNEWSSDSISYDMRPQGDESTIFSAHSAPTASSGRISFDVTQAVCEARHLGITSLTFRIVGDETAPTAFSGKKNSKNAPRLYLKASDNTNIVCASDAALAALATNQPAFITMPLLSAYTSSNGTSAKINWREYSYTGKDLNNRHITESGEINRPKWFEGDANILAVAEIRSGKYRMERSYSLTIPAETAPNYSGYKFDNYIGIGVKKIEEKQKFEYVNVSGIKRRWVDGQMFTYRTLEDNGAMLFNFSCTPNSQNYITLKLWKSADLDYSNFILSSYGRDLSSITLEAPASSAEVNDGFIYATYALPYAFTQGKTQANLCLSYLEDDVDDDKFIPVDIYAAYLTQAPFFNPKLFSKQGEKTISKSYFSENSIAKFIDTLKLLSIPLNFNDTAAPQINQTVSIDKETGNIVFVGDDANIAFTIGESATIYQRLKSYDRYVSGCPVIKTPDVTAVDYGDYKLIWNLSETDSKTIPYDQMDMSGTYKEVLSGNYFDFTEEWQITDDSAVPEGISILDGKLLDIPPGRALLLMHIANPIANTDWRVTKINEIALSELNFDSKSQIKSVTVKSFGGVSSAAENVTVMLAVYENEKMISVYRKHIPVSSPQSTYTVDTSDYNPPIKNGSSIRIFVFDNTENLTELIPKLELSQ